MKPRKDPKKLQTHALELGDVEVSLFERFFCGKDHWFVNHFVRHGDKWCECLCRLCLIAANIGCVVSLGQRSAPR